MAAVKSAPSLSSAGQVRAFASEQGIVTGERGVLAQSLVDAYNEAHPEAPYRKAGFRKTEDVTYPSANGRKVTRTVVIEAARKALIEAGHPVGSKGPLSREALVLVASGKVPNYSA